MSGAAGINPPAKLTAQHDVSSFDSGEPALDDWLRRRALQNQHSGASRTYVICADGKVAGYYSLAAGAVARAMAPGRVRRNMPDAVPAIVLGRLAVAQSRHGQGLGKALLRDAILRTLQAAELAGIRIILVHAISAAARTFYEKHGFAASPLDPMTLMITVADAARSLR